MPGDRSISLRMMLDMTYTAPTTGPENTGSHLTYRFTRAGQSPSNPAQWSTRAEAAVNAAAAQGTGSIMLARDGARTTGTMTVPAATAPSQPWMSLAQAYGSKAAQLTGDALAEHQQMIAGTPAVSVLRFVPSLNASSVQAGADPVELARILSTALPDGAWVAATWRRRTSREYAQWTRWLAHRRGTATGGTHHSLRSGAVAVTFTAGAQDRVTAEAVLTSLASSMPGFDLEVRPRPLRPFHRFLAGLPLGAAAIAAALFIPHGMELVTDPELAEMLGQAAGVAVPALWALGVLATVIGVAALANVIPSERRRFRRAAAKAVPFVPPRRSGRVRAPRKEQTITGTRKDSEGNSVPFTKHISAHPGDYPFDEDVFLCHPEVFAAIASPHGSAGSGEAAATDRATPPALIEATGPFIGTNQGDRVRLNAADLNLGAAIFGRSGSGKSLLVQALYGWACLERVSPSGAPGHPGRSNALVAFESKGEGAWAYKNWASTLGDKVLLLDAADSSTHSLDVFDVPGTVLDKAAYATSAMVYVYGEDAVGARSREALDAVFPAAFALSRSVVEPRCTDAESIARVLVAEHSAPRWAYILLGGMGDAAFLELAAVIKAWSQDTSGGAPDPSAVAAWGALEFLVDKTPANRAAYCEAPRNKVKDLAVQLDVWFNPERKSVSWSQVGDRHRSVIINTGSSPTGRAIDDVRSKVLSSLLMYSLWDYVKRTCSGWGVQGRYVSLYTDELSLLAGAAGEVMTQFKDQGRSYGFRATLATQRPEQLPAALRNNLMSYDTLISFPQNDPATAGEVAEAVGSEWTKDDIRYIEPYHAVVRTTVNGRMQHGVIVAVPQFAADIENFAAAQTPEPTLGGAR